MLENENKKGNKIVLQRADIVKTCNVRPTKMVGHVELMKIQQTPTRIVTATTEETRKT
jgi:hypothetical protein